jgi:hypothetical protein
MDLVSPSWPCVSRPPTPSRWHRRGGCTTAGARVAGTRKAITERFRIYPGRIRRAVPEAAHRTRPSGGITRGLARPMPRRRARRHGSDRLGGQPARRGTAGASARMRDGRGCARILTRTATDSRQGQHARRQGAAIRAGLRPGELRHRVRFAERAAILTFVIVGWHPGLCAVSDRPDAGTLPPLTLPVQLPSRVQTGPIQTGPIAAGHAGLTVS